MSTNLTYGYRVMVAHHVLRSIHHISVKRL